MLKYDCVGVCPVLILFVAYSGVMDLVLAFLPWPIVMRMRMRLRERIGVAIAMTMGVL